VGFVLKYKSDRWLVDAKEWHFGKHLLVVPMHLYISQSNEISRIIQQI
jgi:hypothetical protein